MPEQDKPGSAATVSNFTVLGHCCILRYMRVHHRMYRGRHQCSQAWQQRQEAAQQQRRAAWGTIYEAIHTLHAQGTPVTTIAQQLGISRPTV